MLISRIICKITLCGVKTCVQHPHTPDLSEPPGRGLKHTYWATWRQILQLACLHLHSGEAVQKWPQQKDACTLDDVQNSASCSATSKSNYFSRGKSRVVVCSICGCVRRGLSFYPDLAAEPDVMWVGSTVSPAVSMQCGCLSCYCRLIAASPIPPPTLQANVLSWFHQDVYGYVRC